MIVDDCLDALFEKCVCVRVCFAIRILMASVGRDLSEI